MASIDWLNIKKQPAYKDAVAEVERMIAAQVKPLKSDLAEAEQAVKKLEREVADLKTRLP